MSEKKKILFVDDEPKVLRGIERMMMTIPHDWDLIFAGGGKEALDLMANDGFEVIVSDIRMPEMSGTELLEQVRERFPATVRIALSGQVENQGFSKSVGPIHQFLAKPCSAETLKSTIIRACALKGLLANEKLSTLASEMESLPSLPEAYEDLLEEINHPDASAKTVGMIVSKDMSMTAKLLQLVNSAFFGVGRNISDPAQAVMMIGMKVVKDLAMVTHTFSQFKVSKSNEFSLDALWSHSTLTSGFAEKIAKLEKADRNTIDETITAGLLHDLGKLVLASKLPSEYDEILVKAKNNGVREHDSEVEEMGTSHAEIGAYLLGLWGLNDCIVETVAFHHEPSRSSDKKFSSLTAVHVANELAIKFIKTESYENDQDFPVDRDYISKLGLEDRLSVWEDACRESMQEMNASD